MESSPSQVNIEGISIHLGDLQMGILARKGTVRLSGCRIFVTKKSVIKLGLIVLPGAKLIAENTLFEGLGTAAVVHSGGSVALNGCRFEECVEGVQVRTRMKI